MEWNSKSTTEWEWENTAIYSGGAIEMDRVLAENGSTYSSADLGIGSSSKSSISTYMYPSTKDETKNFGEIDNGFPEYYRGKEEYEHPGLDKICKFPVPGASSIVAGEPMIGLKLGGHSYFEEICASNPNESVSLSVIPASSSSSSTKRARASYQCTQTPRCQVEGCNLDLTSAKDYHRRHRICESHSKCPRVIVAGLERRFCQQCSRFHDLSEFDGKKRSCRRRLSDHNARRRRQQPEVIQFGATRLSSLYDQRPQMNFLLNGVPIRVSNQIWERGSGSRVSEDSLSGHLNGGEFDRRLNFHNTSMPNAIPLPPQVVNHGAETSAITTTSYYNGGAPPKELHRALSLLSTDSRPLNNSQQFTSLHHHQQQLLAPEFSSYPLMNSDPPNFPLSSADLHNNASSSTQFQEFQLFYSNHIN